MTPRSWVLPEELRRLAESGEGDLVQEVLAVFQTDTSQRLATLRAALAANDRGKIRNQAHALKGSAGQVGAVVVAAICQKIESESPVLAVADLEELLGRLQTAFDEVSREMRA